MPFIPLPLPVFPEYAVVVILFKFAAYSILSFRLLFVIIGVELLAYIPSNVLFEIVLLFIVGEQPSEYTPYLMLYEEVELVRVPASE